MKNKPSTEEFLNSQEALIIVSNLLLKSAIKIWHCLFDLCEMSGLPHNERYVVTSA